MKRCILIPCVLIPLTLAACGGGASTGADSGDEKQISEAIQKSLIEPSPIACKELETTDFIEQTTHLTGAAALKACEAQKGSANGESVEVANVKVSGTDATADASFAGGDFGDQALTIALVKDGERWKLDELASFAKLDKDALIGTIEKQLSQLDPKTASCITDGLKSASDEVFEGLLLHGDASKLEDLAKSCVTAG